MSEGNFNSFYFGFCVAGLVGLILIATGSVWRVPGMPLPGEATVSLYNTYGERIAYFQEAREQMEAEWNNLTE